MSKRTRISFEEDLQEEEETNLPTFKKKVMDGGNLTFSDDVIYEIISFMIQDEFIVQSCSLISKQWQSVILKYSKLSISFNDNRKHFHVIETSQFLPNIVQITIIPFYCEENIFKTVLNMPNLKTLILNQFISNEQALDIKNMPQLTTISIGGLTSKECIKSITNSKQLTALIYNSEMRPHNRYKMVEYLGRMKQLKHLEIPNCGLFRQMERFKETDQLTHLNTSFNYLKMIGFREITKFNQLKYLNVSENRISDGDVTPTRLLTQLTTLDISHNGIKIRLVEYIKELKLLTDLNISFNWIESEGAKLLSEMNQLTKLDIESNKIGFEGAKHICEMKQLKSLNIRNNNIGDEGIKLIAGMNQLTHLYIEN